MRADLVRVRSGQQPLAPVVMSEDERTALLNPAAGGHTRRINGAGTRHAPPAVPPVRYDDRGGYDGYDGDPDRGRGRRIAIGVASVVVLALLGLTAYLIFGGSPTVKQVAVPDVSGQQPEAARAALQAANLLTTIKPITSTVDQKGRVVSTDPAANSQVAERSTVTLQVGNGPDQAAVPPLTGKTVADAGPLLIERGLVLGAQTEQNTADPTQIGKILSSSPAAGENVPAGTAVAVVVGKQQATVAVPNVAGRNVDDAARQLQQAGFQVKRTDVDAGGSQDDVVGSDPPAGTQVAPGSTVTLQVTTGDGSEPKMPDVTGDRLRDAQRKLQQEGINDVSLQPQATTDKGEDGRVLDQTPSSGDRVAPGDRVVLVVGQLSGSGGSSGSSSPSSGPGGGTRPWIEPCDVDPQDTAGRGRAARVAQVRVLVVDNYDSFVYNLVQYLAQLGADTVVRRNDVVDLDELDDVDGVLVSPGPGTPERAGASIEVIRASAARALPVLGVCLGHQAIGVAWGGVVERAPELLHGKTSLVHHDGAGVLAGLPDPFVATRYHSLSIRPDTVPDALEVTGRTAGGVVMAVRHRELPVEGVQFHPESVLTARRAPDARQLDGLGGAPGGRAGGGGPHRGDRRGQRPSLTRPRARYRVQVMPGPGPFHRS